MSREEHRLRVNIRNRDLLCVNGCGFYGTPQWENRCSKCWRIHQAEQKKSDDYMKNKVAFRQFEEKRKLSTESRTNTLKNFLKKSPSLASAPSGSESVFHSSSSTGHISASSSPSSTVRSRALSPRRRHRSPDSQMARDELISFFTTHLPSTLTNSISKSLTSLMSQLYETQSADDLSSIVQTYYAQLEQYLNSQSAFTNNKIQSITQEDVMEAVESFICASCYGKLFWIDNQEEVEDISLQERIRSLHWVTFGFLETKLDLSQQEARDRVDEAINEMIDINSHRRVHHKLQCLLRCSHKIFDALRASGAPTSADEFVPALIYVLLKGNPPLIQSNVRFISRFALPSRVMSGEPAYFFTNVSGALQFVQEINHESLKMSREEFEAYTSGELAPPLNKMNCGCNHALSSMESSIARMNRLLEEQQELANKIADFERSVSVEEQSLCDEIERLCVSIPSQEWCNYTEKVARAEKMANDACSLNSSGGSARVSSEDDTNTSSGTLCE